MYFINLLKESSVENDRTEIYMHRISIVQNLQQSKKNRVLYVFYYFIKRKM